MLAVPVEVVVVVTGWALPVSSAESGFDEYQDYRRPLVRVRMTRHVAYD